MELQDHCLQENHQLLVFYLKKSDNIKKILSRYYDDENIIVFMGAGSITKIAQKFIEDNNVQKNTKVIR